MEIVYRLMGLAASLGERLSHVRVNFVPLNVPLMLGLGSLALTAGTEAREALVNLGTPRHASVGDVVAHRDMERNYVAVHGILVPGTGFEEREAGEVRHSYVPLVDAEGRQGLLVEVEGEIGDEPPRAGVHTGMLRPMEHALWVHLKEEGGAIDGVPMDTSYVLHIGARPGDARLFVALTAASGLALLLLAVTWLKRYVVYRRDASASAIELQEAASLAEGIAVGATGLFRLDDRTARRFLDVPSVLTRAETGELVISAHVDASEKFMGEKVADRKGVWVIASPASGLHGGVRGWLYRGLGRRPALRLRMAGEAGARESEAILTFATPAARSSAIAALNRVAGYPVM